MDKSSYAVLYYDAGAKLIGVQLTTDAKADGARKVRLQQSGAAVSTRGFAEFFGISIPEAVTVDVGKDSKTGYLTLALANGKPSRKGARSK
jgi:hypothetical protein